MKSIAVTHYRTTWHCWHYEGKGQPVMVLEIVTSVAFEPPTGFKLKLSQILLNTPGPSP